MLHISRKSEMAGGASLKRTNISPEAQASRSSNPNLESRALSRALRCHERKSQLVCAISVIVRYDKRG